MMSDELIDLRSINWSHGMFLTPEHFLRQERYFESLALWLVRHCLWTHGLIGGGPRVEPSEWGAARFDPIVTVDENDEYLKIAVSQCRGLTMGGGLVEIDPSHPLEESFPKKELEGATDLGVYVLAQPNQKEPDAGVEDPVNPGLPAGRRAKYWLRLELAAQESDWGLLLTRLRRRQQGLRFEKVSGFIPPCAFMCSHSELMQCFRQLNERVGSIADRFSLLHRAVVDFIAIARARAIDLEQDRETLAFVSRMVVAMDDCAYEILDPRIPPGRFFQLMTKLVRSSLVFLSLSPATQEYFQLLGQLGETEFVSTLNQGSEALGMQRRWSPHENLRLAFMEVLRVLEGLDRLEQALEGKYMDFRVSPSLEGMNFVFDRTAGEPVLFKSVAKPARPQAQGQELTFVFAPLRLEAKDVYRLILVGDRGASFVSGDKLHVEIRINKGEGYREAQYKTAAWELEGHRNFAIDFRAPDDVVSINDIRVSLRGAQPVRSAILYVRARLMPGLQLRVDPAPLLPRDDYPPPPARIAPAEIVRSAGRAREESQEEVEPHVKPRRSRLIE